MYGALDFTVMLKIVSKYDQEIPQSQTADNPMALRVGKYFYVKGDI